MILTIKFSLSGFSADYLDKIGQAVTVGAVGHGWLLLRKFAHE
jgi:hypothetical protein